MNFDANNPTPLLLLSASSVRIRSLEKHVQKWLALSLKLIELWQNAQNDARKMQLIKILFSNQRAKPSSNQLPRIVDLVFHTDSNHSDDPQTILTFSEEATTVRIVLCTRPTDDSSMSHLTFSASIEDSN